MRHGIVDGINRALTVRGLTLVTSDADLAIAAHAAIEERTRDTFYNGGGWRGGGWSWFGGFDPDTATGSSSGGDAGGRTVRCPDEDGDLERHRQ